MTDRHFTREYNGRQIHVFWPADVSIPADPQHRAFVERICYNVCCTSEEGYKIAIIRSGVHSTTRDIQSPVDHRNRSYREDQPHITCNFAHYADFTHDGRQMCAHIYLRFTLGRSPSGSLYNEMEVDRVQYFRA